MGALSPSICRPHRAPYGQGCDGFTYIVHPHDPCATIHAEQRFAYTRPIVAGDELTARLTVTGIRAMGPAAMITSDAEIRDAAGAHVVTATAVLLVSDAPAEGAEEATA